MSSESIENMVTTDTYNVVQMELMQARNQKRFYSIIAAITKAQPNLFDYIPDKGTINAQKLAKKTNLDENMIYRCLRYVSSYGYTKIHEDDTFSHTDKSKTLKSDSKMNDELKVSTSLEYFSSYATAESLLEKGADSFKHHFGKRFYGHDGYLNTFPDKAPLWDKYFRSLNSMDMLTSIAKSYDFGQFNAIADIGGNVGHMLVSIMNEHPSIEMGYLYDTKDTCDHARDLLKDCNKNIKIIDGDFFKENDIKNKISADCYMMKWVLHDWNDKECIHILKNIRDAMKEDQILVIYEIGIIKDNTELNKQYLALEMDMHMALMTGGNERSLQQFDYLLRTTGFQRIGKPIKGMMVEGIVAKAVTLTPNSLKRLFDFFKF